MLLLLSPRGMVSMEVSKLWESGASEGRREGTEGVERPEDFRDLARSRLLYGESTLR